MTSGVSTPTTSRWTDGRLPVLILGVAFVPTAVQAAFFPRSFYDDFPLGRGWVAVDGAFNEHLVRDVGALFLALVVLSIWAWWRPALVVPVAVAWLVEGTLHLLYHGGHLDGLEGVDRVGLVLSLAFVPVMAVAAIVGGRRAEPQV